VIEQELKRYPAVDIPLFPRNTVDLLRRLDLWAEFKNIDPRHRAKLAGRLRDATLKDAATNFIVTEEVLKEAGKEAEEARKKLEDEAKKAAEEARKKLEDEAKKAAEEARKKLEDEAKKKAEEAEDLGRKAEEEARKKAEELRNKIPHPVASSGHSADPRSYKLSDSRTNTRR
jgi:ElaB/YqjD/DUF883 family membrane-anchored ribosome-binding protein